MVFVLKPYIVKEYKFCTNNISLETHFLANFNTAEYVFRMF